MRWPDWVLLLASAALMLAGPVMALEEWRAHQDAADHVPSAETTRTSARRGSRHASRKEASRSSTPVRASAAAA
ncbi:MAG TPA: hypothetical protein VNX21_01445, partial [Candidatus Thermoplasmatota archaeon]|nr:hypothetical protein [Candidatus Thermoplasmatota archaeon]